MPVAISVVTLLFAALLLWGIYTLYIPFAAIYAAAVPCVLFLLLVWYMKRKIQGYTGDCCGASFLLCELSFYIASLAIINVQL